MSRRKIKPWTDEQWAKYYVKGIVEREDIESWTCGQLVLHVVHELTQDVAVAYGYSEMLLHEEGYGFVCEKQKEALMQLQSKIQAIHALSEMMRYWLLGEDD